MTKRVRLTAALLVAAVPAAAWHTPVHQMITRAALETLPAPMRAFWGEEGDRLASEYCLYPDKYRGSAPEVRETMRPYCEWNGRPIHHLSWKRADDVALFEHLLRTVAAAIRSGDATAAAKHAGTLAHVLEDASCPSHALIPFDSPLEIVKDMLPPPAERRTINLHSVIEVRAPEVQLGGRAPERLSAGELLDRTYAAVKANRGRLLDLAPAAYAQDDEAMNPARHEAAVAGARLLADALYSAHLIAENGSR